MNYIKYSCMFLCHNFWIFPNYILLERKINTFWSGRISIIGNTKSLRANIYILLIYTLRQNVFKMRQEKLWAISSLYVLNCSKYFGRKYLKNITQEKLHQVFMHNFSVSKWLDIYKDFYTKSRLCSKIFQYFHFVNIKSINQ